VGGQLVRVRRGSGRRDDERGDLSAPDRVGHPDDSDVRDGGRTDERVFDLPGRTAEVLHCHANTIRYRLRRIEDLTGRSLRNPQGLAEIVMALNALRVVDRAHGQVAGSG
jgi:hypothetical protein